MVSERVVNEESEARKRGVYEIQVNFVINRS
jgi:hypothetical protein